ncbi:hypothetical protein TrVE_jg2792 [Triparma verrucosa]|uniref:Aminotransferase class I/classII large domain-containing protein n=1 Tax=Triparma verrucosa TaxID=1606542 RepID=A0A9W7EP01_9STRA|nr:hypothetical protein TrVE_jg2792 [Triparma verrucosa]
MKDGSGVVLDEDETKAALQYSASRGLPCLVSHLKSLQTKVHGLDFKRGKRDVIVTNGSQDGLAKAFEMLLEPRVDTLLVESPTYSGSLAFLGPASIHLQGVQTDEHGMIPSDLRRVLESWEVSNPKRKKPRVLYTIPTGSNPSGGSLSLARKNEIYQVAVEHNLIILEDDPYYFLDFEGSSSPDGPARCPSLLSIDERAGGARVLRFDSFSKLLSAGIRVGFATGPSKLIESIELHTQASMLHASGVSQAVVSKIFDHLGGVDGFLTHVDDVTSFYRERRDALVASVERHLSEFVEFESPKAGMFLWMKLKGVKDSNDLIMNKAVERKVLMVPGASFIPTNNDEPNISSFVRASYSTASVEEMDEACQRLRDLLKK